MAGIAPDLKVRLDDGVEYSVRNTYADLMAWERYALAHGLDTTKSFMAMTAFYAWRGARKQGLCDQGTDLDTWAERIAELEAVDDEEPVPTLPVRGAG